MPYRIEGSFVGSKIPARKRPKIKRDFRKHAIKRVSERYGLELSKGQCNEIIKLVINKECISVPNDRCTDVKIVELKGRRMAFIWQKNFRRIETALPPEWGRDKYGIGLVPNNNQKLETIRQRAYFKWIEEGHPCGREVDHWLAAESEVAKLPQFIPFNKLVELKKTKC